MYGKNVVSHLMIYSNRWIYFNPLCRSLMFQSLLLCFLWNAVRAAWDIWLTFLVNCIYNMTRKFVFSEGSPPWFLLYRMHDNPSISKQYLFGLHRIFYLLKGRSLVFRVGVVDICVYGTIRSPSQLAPWHARYTTPCCFLACMERRWYRVLILGCQLLWEGISSQRWGSLVSWSFIIYKLEWYLLEAPYVYVCLLKCYLCLSRLDLGVAFPLEMEFCSTLVRCSHLHVNQLLQSD